MGRSDRNHFFSREFSLSLLRYQKPPDSNSNPGSQPRPCSSPDVSTGGTFLTGKKNHTWQGILLPSPSPKGCPPKSREGEGILPLITERLESLDLRSWVLAVQCGEFSRSTLTEANEYLSRKARLTHGRCERPSANKLPFPDQ